MNTYFKNIFSGGWSLCVGMGITLRYFFKPVVTKSYPHEVLPITPRYRAISTWCTTRKQAQTDALCADRAKRPAPLAA